MFLVKNLPTQLWETEEENRRREWINEKPPELDEEIWEENQKIIDLLMNREADKREDLDNKGLGW